MEWNMYKSVSFIKPMLFILYIASQLNCKLIQGVRVLLQPVRFQVVSDVKAQFIGHYI